MKGRAADGAGHAADQANGPGRASQTVAARSVPEDAAADFDRDAPRRREMEQRTIGKEVLGGSLEDLAIQTMDDDFVEIAQGGPPWLVARRARTLPEVFGRSRRRLDSNRAAAGRR